MFTIGIHDPYGPCKRWVMGHSYDQNAWSYNSQTVTLPANEQRRFTVTLNNQQPGNAAVSFYLVSFN